MELMISYHVQYDLGVVEGNGENNRRRLGFPVDGDFSDRHDRTRVEVLCVGAVVISNEYVNS